MPVIGGRYEPLEVLGEGAFARTVRARDRETGVEVAVKVMHPSRMASLGDFERFEREAETLKALSHVAIPRYLDRFIWRYEGEDLYCLAQEYRRGTALSARLAARERFDEAAILALGEALLAVLDYLASREPPVVHRDIKPANILLDDRGQPSLVDFGGVREAVRQTIQAGSTVIGTFGFVPPEQLIGQVTPASDIFSVGVTLVCALTRRDAASLSSDGFSIRVDDLALGVSPGLRQVLATMLAPRLDERYTEPAHALADLRAVARGEPPRHTEAHVRRAAQRVAREQREAQRRLARGVSGVYRILAAFLALLVVGVGVAAIQMLGKTELDGGMLALAVLSFAGLGVTFGGVVTRYSRHTWDPPDLHWHEVIAEVREHHTTAESVQLTAVLSYELYGETRTTRVGGNRRTMEREFAVGSRHRYLASPAERNHLIRERSPVDVELPPRRNR